MELGEAVETEGPHKIKEEANSHEYVADCGQRTHYSLSPWMYFATYSVMAKESKAYTIATSTKIA